MGIAQGESDMKISKLASAVVMAAVCAVALVAVRAHGEGDRRWGGDHKGGEGEHRGGTGDKMGRPEPDPAMREKFEKMRELEHKLRETKQKLRKGSDLEKAAAKTEMRKILGEILDAKLAVEEGMLAKMEKHAAELKEKIAKKKSNREKMIDEKLAHLVGDNDWD